MSVTNPPSSTGGPPSNAASARAAAAAAATATATATAAAATTTQSLKRSVQAAFDGAYGQTAFCALPPHVSCALSSIHSCLITATCSRVALAYHFDGVTPSIPPHMPISML